VTVVSDGPPVSAVSKESAQFVDVYLAAAGRTPTCGGFFALHAHEMSDAALGDFIGHEKGISALAVPTLHGFSPFLLL
jgi:hypothetical protein